MYVLIRLLDTRDNEVLLISRHVLDKISLSDVRTYERMYVCMYVCMFVCTIAIAIALHYSVY